MPPLTDSEESKTDEESEDSNREEEPTINEKCLNNESPQKFNKAKSIHKRKKSNPRNIPPESMSESSDGLSDSDTGNDEDPEEDFSDEDHAFLISSVAKPREIMQLKPLQTKSKKTHKMKGRTLDINVNQPIISVVCN